MRTNALQDASMTYQLYEALLQQHLPTPPSSISTKSSALPIQEETVSPLSALISYLKSVTTYAIPLSRIVQQTGYPESLILLLMDQLRMRGMVSVSPAHPGVYIIHHASFLEK